MNMYTKALCENIISQLDREKLVYFGVRLPSSLTQQPIYKIAIPKDERLDKEELLTELRRNELIVSLSSEDDICYRIEINCIKYFYDKEDKSIDYSEFLKPEFVRHFHNYDDKDMYSTKEITDKISDKFTKEEIIKMQTNKMIAQIEKEIDYKRSLETVGLRELQMCIDVIDVMVDSNTLFEYLNKKYYNIVIRIDDYNSHYNFHLSFNFMNKQEV